MIINPYIFGGGTSFDADAQLFITNASITDLTQKNAINTLVTDLKTASIWTKMKAIYPFVGGTASQHRYNLKAPTTNASDFYLIPYGGITHSSNGVQFNGTTGYFDPQLTPYLTLAQNSSHLSFYSRTNTSTYGDMGGQDDFSPNGQFYVIANNSTAGFSIKNTDPGGVSVANTNSQGMFLASRTAASLLKGYKNDVLKGSNTTTSGAGGMNIPALLGAFNYRNSGGTITKYYSGKEFAFASIGDGLTDTEVTNFYTAVQAYQTTLSRNI